MIAAKKRALEEEKKRAQEEEDAEDQLKAKLEQKRRQLEKMRTAADVRHHHRPHATWQSAFYLPPRT